MVILITDASHTGKTLLAQRLMKHYHYPVLSLDLLKMGLIRSGQTELTPEDDELIADNERALSACRERGLRHHLIDGAYDVGRLELGPLGADERAKAARLLVETVHAANARDYTPEQLDAWAPRDDGHRARIAARLAGQLAIGARECGILVGFGSLDGDVVDLLFVHKDRQRQGIARAILAELERAAAEQGLQTLTTFASITARPFFEAMGYTMAHENQAIRNGVSLTNYRMTKQLPS